MAFVMVLSWSRQIFLRFYLNQRMESFLRGHVGAFEAFGGCSRIVLYDNLKSAVLERRGDAIRFNPTLLSLASHYHFEPRPVAVARGNEKGRVERKPFSKGVEVCWPGLLKAAEHPDPPSLAAGVCFFASTIIKNILDAHFAFG